MCSSPSTEPLPIGSSSSSTHDLFGDDAEYVLLNVRRDPMMIAATTIGVGMTRDGAGRSTCAPSTATTGIRCSPKPTSPPRPPGRPPRDTHLDDATVVGEIGLEPDAILSAADEYKVDVIAVGDHDRGWFSQLMSPSVTTASPSGPTCRCWSSASRSAEPTRPPTRRTRRAADEAPRRRSVGRCEARPRAERRRRHDADADLATWTPSVRADRRPTASTSRHRRHPARIVVPEPAHRGVARRPGPGVLERS